MIDNWHYITATLLTFLVRLCFLSILDGLGTRVWIVPLTPTAKHITGQTQMLGQWTRQMALRRRQYRLHWFNTLRGRNLANLYKSLHSLEVLMKWNQTFVFHSAAIILFAIKTINFNIEINLLQKHHGDMNQNEAIEISCQSSHDIDI